MQEGTANRDGPSGQERARRPRAGGSHGPVGRRREDVHTRGTLRRAQERRGASVDPLLARVRARARVHACMRVREPDDMLLQRPHFVNRGRQVGGGVQVWM